MQTQIHPKFNENAQVSCSCGNKFTTGSIKEEISVEVCYKCHPFYTGEQKFLDTKGTVDKFLKREKDAIEFKKTRGSKKDKALNKQEKKTKSLKELLGEI